MGQKKVNAKQVVKLNRPLPFTLRFNEREMGEFRRRAEKAGLHLVEFARYKILDIPFEWPKDKKHPSAA
jgi:hypothetical protein